jgi:transposase
MANQLKLAMLQALLALHQKGWSRRRIARELGIDRETVARYLKQWRAAAAKPAISHTGSDIEIVSKPAIVHTGSEEVSAPKPAIAHTGSPEQPAAETAEPLLAGLPPPGLGLPMGPAAPVGRNSECTRFRDLIQAKADQGLSAQRIWQDLRDEHGFTHSYYSVLRFVRKLAPSRELPFRRLEKAPGEEVQVDFGTGAWLVGPDGKRQRTHVLRMVLSHSRKAYSEAITRQTTDAFIGCLESGFRYFGGVPRTVVIDNLKAAVTKADWFDPELNPKVIAFCQHYHTVMLPTKPYTPRHKGKVERGIDYVQENALKGRTFSSLEEQNRFLLEWERTIADTRIHGTTRRQVGALFSTVEKPTLLPLPAERFANFREGQRIVHRDGHVEVERAYYSVPPEYLGRTVWVRWDGRLVRVFNTRFELIATHVRHLPGSFSTQDTHLHSAKISRVERGAQQLLARADQLGPHVGPWAQAMMQERGVTGIRPLLGLLSLAKKHSPAVLDAACAAAHRHGAYRLRAVRQLAQRHQEQQATAPLLEEHPLIRPLTEYGQVVTVAAWDAVLGAGEPAAPVSPAPKPPPPPSLSLFREEPSSATSSAPLDAAATALSPTE